MTFSYELLGSNAIVEQHVERIAQAAHRVLMLDYDGTLAPFTPDRAYAVPHTGVLERLERLLDDPRSRVIFITGRSYEDLHQLLPVSVNFEVWASHGYERKYTDGRIVEQQLPTRTFEQLREVAVMLETVGLLAQTERKAASLAIHWRGLSEKDRMIVEKIATDILRSYEDGCNLTLHKFDGGIELRPVGIDKGIAVRTIIHETPSSMPIAYLGDDLTDEDAFRALGERGLRVLVRREHRSTIADIQIVPPEQLLAFFDFWLSR